MTHAHLQQSRSPAEPGVAHMIVPIGGMASREAESAIQQAVGSLPGVVAEASFPTRSLRLSFDRRQCPLPEIVRRLDDLGYTADFSHARTDGELIAGESAAAAPTWMRRARTVWLPWLKTQPELLLAMLAGACLLAGFLVNVLDGPQWLRLSLLTISYATASRYTGAEAIQALRELRYNIDVLMFAAAFGAAALGHFEEGALLLFLFALGNTGEHLALSRARGAIEELSRLAPDTARLRDETGAETILPVESIGVDQTIIIRPFERIPLDGEVTGGESTVDQSTITGESIPVEKSAGATVFAGTMNVDGRLLVRVTRSAGQTTLARIIKLVEEAQAAQSPTQRFTAKVERYFVPAVLVVTAALIVVPPLLDIMPRQHGTLWGGWFYQAMAFLTAASPCALAIGTPSAILCGIARTARIGVLIKGGAYLESLGTIDAFAFDKTGTLTLGQPTLTDLIPVGGIDELELLALAAAVERESNHPLAAAIVREAENRNAATYAADGIQQIPGKGMTGRVNNAAIAVGQIEMIPWDDAAEGEAAPREGAVEGDAPHTRAREIARRLADDGRTTVVVWRDSVPIGVLGLADRPRNEARPALEQLKRLGVARLHLLTGDHPHTAAAIAAQTGVDDYAAGLLPEDKLKIIHALQKQFGGVAMVGDGVNDAPALAGASIGIAMGAAGSDVALETADVVLMSSDLRRLPEAVAISRKARRIIVQNLWIALGVIGLMAPVAALGFATLGVAVLLHEGSTVVVVLNSLRLLRQ